MSDIPYTSSGQGTLDRRAGEGPAAGPVEQPGFGVNIDEREKIHKYNQWHVSGGILGMMDFQGILFASLYSSMFPKVSTMTMCSLCNVCNGRRGKGGGVGEEERKGNHEEKRERENNEHAHRHHVVPSRNSTMPLKII